MSDVEKTFKKGLAPFFDPFDVLGGIKDAIIPDIPDPGAPPDPAEAERAGVISAAEKSEERRRRLAQQGRQSTFATSPAGLTTAGNVQRKTLFGQ